MRANFIVYFEISPVIYTSEIKNARFCLILMEIITKIMIFRRFLLIFLLKSFVFVKNMYICSEM